MGWLRVTARVRTAAVVALAVVAIALINQALWWGDGASLMLTPIGASAFMLFSKPLQTKDPWSVIGGVTVSAAFSVLSARIPLLWLACPCAAVLALAGVWTLR